MDSIYHAIQLLMSSATIWTKRCENIAHLFPKALVGLIVLRNLLEGMLNREHNQNQRVFNLLQKQKHSDDGMQYGHQCLIRSCCPDQRIDF